MLTLAVHCGMTRCLLCVLQGSRDCWVWSTVCCPNQGAIHDALSAQGRDFSLVVDVFRSTAACAASPQAAAHAAIEDATHVQSRAASCDSSGGEKISHLDCVSCEFVGFCGDCGSASFSPPRSAGTHAQCPPGGFAGATHFFMLKLRSKNDPHRRPPRHNLFCTW